MSSLLVLVLYVVGRHPWSATYDYFLQRVLLRASFLGRLRLSPQRSGSGLAPVRFFCGLLPHRRRVCHLHTQERLQESFPYVTRVLPCKREAAPEDRGGAS
ncbi:hypothetical protein OTU49_017516, partial [Cherax quadricarinatus]